MSVIPTEPGAAKLLAFDAETYLIRPGLLAPPPVCWSFYYGTGEPWITNAEDGIAFLRAALDGGYTFIGQNVAYDFAVLCAAAPDLIPGVFAAYREGRVRDTQLRQVLIDIANGRKEDNGLWALRKGAWVKASYSLADLETLYLGLDRSADKKNGGIELNAPDVGVFHTGPSWRLDYALLDGIPLHLWPAGALEYPLADVKGTYDVYVAQIAEARKAGVCDVQNECVTNEREQCRAAWALHLISCWGIRTDGERVGPLKAALEVEKAANFEALKAEGFYKVAGTKKAPKWAKDMKAIRARVEKAYGALGKDIPKTDSGATATDRDTLNQSGDEKLAILGDAGGVDKLLTTYIPVLEQGTQVPINPSYVPIMNTGRTSSREPNIQNLPTGRRVGGVRETFVPRAAMYEEVEVPDDYVLQPGEEFL